MDTVSRIFMQNKNNDLKPIDLGKGESSFNPFDFVDASLSRFDLSIHTNYGDINGLLSLRNAICQYYKDRFDYDLSPNRVCITDGASEALTIAFTLLVETNGEVILSESCFPQYRILTNFLKAHCRFVPLNEFYCIDVDQLSTFISPKTCCMIVNSPSNPYGSVLKREAIEVLTSMRVPIIFDEVYQALPLRDENIPSAISYTDQHFLVNSFSKSLGIAGFRLGYLIVPESYAERMKNVKSIINMCTSVPVQLIVEKLFKHWDRLITRHREMLTQHWEYIQHEVIKNGFKILCQPKAGFFIVVDISQINRDTMTVAIDLAKEFSLNIVPGIDFSYPDPKFLRLNFACPFDQIKLALERLNSYFSLNI